MMNPLMKIEKKHFTESLPIRRMILSESAGYEAEKHEITDAERQMIHNLFQKLQAEYRQRSLDEEKYGLFQGFAKSALQFADDNELDVRIEISESLEGYICFVGNTIIVKSDNKYKDNLLFCKLIIMSNEFCVQPVVVDGEPAFEMLFRLDLFKTAVD